ncbi:adenylate/guanylate cyclase domain-containing protein [Phormidium nigroviride]
MLGFRQLRIKSKLTIALLVVTLGSTAIVGILTWNRAKSILTQRIFNQLTSVRAAKSAQIESYFQFINNQIETLSEDRMIVTAMVDFNQSFNQLNQSTPTISPNWNQLIKKYYTKEFFPRLSKNIEGTPVFELYAPKTKVAQYLQYHYIANNSHPVGKKDELMAATDGSEYSTVHSKYHKILRNLIKKFGYYDLFLINPETEEVVYSVYKETDFTSNLKTGPYAQSNLASVVAAVKQNPDPGAVQIVDFASYRPSYGAPAAFMAVPIYQETQLVGILAVQLPVDEINSILTGNRGWEREGLGKTGETYLVGSDYLMRSISRFLIEDRMNYYQALRSGGTPERIIQTIEQLKTSILLQRVETEGSKKALQGKQGTEIINDYRQVPVLSSYAPLKIKGINWVVLSEIDLAEAYEPLNNLQNYIIILAVVLVLFVTLISLVAANNFVKPIEILIQESRQIMRGKLEDAELQSTTQDELSHLVKTFNEMIRSLQDQTILAEQRQRENEELLLNILPSTVAQRWKTGEEGITDETEQATILVASLEGINELSTGRGVSEVASLLNEMINGFDAAAQQLDVLGITRIGELYFAVCGLATPRLDHTKRVVELGLEMLDILQAFNNKYNLNLKLRIGIDAGKIMGAVIEAKSFSYYIWGEGLAIASQLNRMAAPNTIRIPNEVHERVRDLYIFQPAEEIELVEIGQVSTWVLSRNLLNSASEAHDRNKYAVVVKEVK